jgi:hypothetical protein
MNKIYNAIISANIILSTMCFFGIVLITWLFIHAWHGVSDRIFPSRESQWYDSIYHYCVHSPKGGFFSTEPNAAYRVIIQNNKLWIENHFLSDDSNLDDSLGINESRYFIEYKGKRYAAYINANNVDTGYIAYMANVGEGQNAQTIIFKELFEKSDQFHSSCYVHLSGDKNKNIDKGSLKISFPDY